MFARVIEFTPNMEKKDEMIRTIRQEVLPVLRRQQGFLELLPLIPENTQEKFIHIALWAEKAHAERFIKSDAFAKVEKLLKPFLVAPDAYTIRVYNVETTLCQHMVDALMAVA